MASATEWGNPVDFNATVARIFLVNLGDTNAIIMTNRIVIVDPARLLERVKRVERGDDEVLELPSECFKIEAENISPPAGHRYPPGFPYCCEYHKDMFDRACGFYDNFR